MVHRFTPGGARAHPDLQAAAWVGLERALATYDGRGRWTSWVKRCVRGYVSNQRRAWATRMKIGEPLGAVDDVAQPSAPPPDPFVRAAIERAFAALPPRQAEAARLCFVEGRTQDEAAVSMGVSSQAVNQLLLRARARLQSALRHLNPTPETT